MEETTQEIYKAEITKAEDLRFCYQAENNINAILNATRRTETEINLFCDSLKFLIEQFKIKPSVQRLFNIAEMEKSNANRQRVFKLLQNDRITLKEGLHIKPIWVKLSNGSLIKNRYATYSRYIDAIK